MIHPTCREVLATVAASFSREIVPELSSIEARSSAATIEHLLRHVMLRIEEEGEVLMRDIARLRTLLAHIADWMEQTGAVSPESLSTALANEPADLWTLQRQGDEALRLRASLVAVQAQLDGLAGDWAGNEGYQALRREIGGYIGAQLMDEARLIAPAFSGRGPRR
ncbi:MULTISPECIES: hypothetical protein [unclassified Novosphingobium]|uniref:hypothetical protein n=1 Tax=unclassified Novosphingobium TaxID=2644732 RepID=UPI00135B7EB9|nr:MULTISPECIES: hypothetical protein [unclassified Novosphingobium]